MWPFKKREEKDSLAENLIQEIELLAQNTGDWTHDSLGGYKALVHKNGVVLARYGQVAVDRAIIDMTAVQRDRMSHCYNEMLIAKALSACIAKD